MPQDPGRDAFFDALSSKWGGVPNAHAESGSHPAGVGTYVADQAGGAFPQGKETRTESPQPEGLVEPANAAFLDKTPIAGVPLPLVQEMVKEFSIGDLSKLPTDEVEAAAKRYEDAGQKDVAKAIRKGQRQLAIQAEATVRRKRGEHAVANAIQAGLGLLSQADAEGDSVQDDADSAVEQNT